MNKEQLIAMGLTEEQADRVMESLNGNFVTKARFDEVNNAKNKLETDVSDRDKQLDELQKIKPEELRAEITRLQGENAAAKETYEAEVKKLRINSAVETALMAAKAKNTTAARALLADFLEKAEFDGDKIKGLDDAVKGLAEAEDTKFLFDTESKPTLKGVKPAESKGGRKEGNPFSVDSYDEAEQIRMFRENPEAAKELARQAGIPMM